MKRKAQTIEFVLDIAKIKVMSNFRHGFYDIGRICKIVLKKSNIF